MSVCIPEGLLKEFSEFVEKHIGLHFPDNRLADLEKGLRNTSMELGFDDIVPCIEWLMGNPLNRRQIEMLASHLTIGETYFFRDRQVFDLLETTILPPLIGVRRGKEQRLRIWSAGCCTGEEPYSIAMIVVKLIPDFKDWQIDILGTDINPHFLKKALDGVYGNWSFRDCPEQIKTQYFQKTASGRFEIAPRIKDLVTFSYLNLVEDVYPSLSNDTNAMDVIFCRNVLMYFSPDQAKKVARKLSPALTDEAWLITSPSETSQVLFSDFDSVVLNGTTLYRKRKPAKASPAPAVPPCAPFVSQPRSKPSVPSLNLPSVPAVEPAPVPAFVKSPAATDDAAAFSSRARASANEGRLTEALEWCDKALAADKLNPATHYLRGVILQEHGSLDEAIAALKRALYLDHNFPLAHFALGNLSRRCLKYADATRCFDNALDLLRRRPSDEVLAESEGITAGRLSAIIRSIQEANQ